MITSWDIYWITRLDSINCFSAVVVSLCLTMLIASLAIGFAEEDNVFHFKKSIIISSITSFVFLSCLLFIPTTKEFAAIYLIPKIANNEQMQKIPDNAVKLLNAKMEEWLKDTIKDKKEDK